MKYAFAALICLLMMTIAHTPIPAQTDLSDYQVITPENVLRLTEIARIGRGRFYDLAWSPDGTTLAAATETGVWLYDAQSVDLPPRLLLDAVLSTGVQLDYPPDGKTLVVYGERNLWVWDVPSYEVHHEITLARGDIVSVVGEDYLVNMGNELRRHYLHHPAIQDVILSSADVDICDAALSPDLEQIVVITDDETLTVLETLSGDPLDTVKILTFADYPEDFSICQSIFYPHYGQLFYSPNADYIAISTIYRIELYSVASRELYNLQGFATFATFSPHSRYFLSTGYFVGSTDDLRLRLSGFATLSHISSSAHSIVVPHVMAFSPDETQMAVGAGGLVRLDGADQYFGARHGVISHVLFPRVNNGHLYFYARNNGTFEPPSYALWRYNLWTEQEDYLATCEEITQDPSTGLIYCVVQQGFVIDDPFVRMVGINEAIPEVEATMWEDQLPAPLLSPNKQLVVATTYRSGLQQPGRLTIQLPNKETPLWEVAPSSNVVATHLSPDGRLLFVQTENSLVYVYAVPAKSP